MQRADAAVESLLCPPQSARAPEIPRSFVCLVVH